jgi:F420H(2)-dependent quinone reductase
VTARVLSAEERAPIWEEQKARYPGFADYEANTDRVIPVVMLDRR